MLIVIYRQFFKQDLYLNLLCILKIDLREVIIFFDNDWQKKKLIELFFIEFFINNIYFVWGINISCLIKNF